MNRQSADEVSADRSGRHPELFGSLREEGSSGRLFEDEAGAVRTAMRPRERGQAKRLVFDKDAVLDLDQLDVDRRSSAAHDHSEEEISDPLHGPGAGPNLQSVNSFPARERREQPGQA